MRKIKQSIFQSTKALTEKKIITFLWFFCIFPVIHHVIAVDLLYKHNRYNTKYYAQKPTDRPKETHNDCNEGF